MIRLGVHCSLRNGFSGAVREAQALGCQSMQMFTRSPRMWRMRQPGDAEIEEFIRLRAEADIHPLVVHTPYLPNLATSKEELYKLSVNSLTDDLAIAERIRADYLVIHPGAYSPEADLATGIDRITRALNAILDAVPGRVALLIENMAGGGRRIGSSFAELRRITGAVRQKSRIGVCLDSAHAFGAGYDIRTRGGVSRTIAAFAREMDVPAIKVLHLNDSLAPLASRKDRHQHIGRGHIGLAGFRALLARMKETAEAGILETPKLPEFSDKKNLAALFKLLH